MKKLIVIALVCVVVGIGLGGTGGAVPGDVEPIDSAGGPIDEHSAVADDSLGEPTDEPSGEPTAGTVATDRCAELEIHHLDVGQADATLLVAPSGETILIDTGDWWQDGEPVIEYLDALGIDRVDHLVATHAHADHIGGHAAVIEYLETEGAGVGAAYDAGIAHPTMTYERYLDAVEEHDVDLYRVREGDRLALSDDHLEARVLNPPADSGNDDLHYNSVTLSITYDQVTYLTTGDAETEAEARMVEEWRAELDADVYQAGHHGSSTSSSAPFLQAVGPDVVVVSSDRESQYGHPHDAALERFAAVDAETFWTGVHGTVVVRTDGDRVEVEPAEPFTTDPTELRASNQPDRPRSTVTLPDHIATLVDGQPA